MRAGSGLRRLGRNPRGTLLWWGPSRADVPPTSTGAVTGPHWLPCWPSDSPSKFRAQGLCTFYFLCLHYSCLVFLQGSLTLSLDSYSCSNSFSLDFFCHPLKESPLSPSPCPTLFPSLQGPILDIITSILKLFGLTLDLFMCLKIIIDPEELMFLWVTPFKVHRIRN